MPGLQAGLTLEQCRQQLANFERDYRLNPTHAGCAGNYASVLFTLGRVAEAIPIFEAACQTDRKLAGNFINSAMAYKELGRFDEAARSLEFGYHSDPDNFYHALGYSESLLRAGMWRQAWPIYEEARITKFTVKNEQEIPPALPELKRDNIELLDRCGQPASRLPDGSKPRIAVYGEGGIGDRICYSRFLPWLERYGFDFTYFPDAGIVNNPGFSCLPLFQGWSWANARALDGTPLVASAWTTQFALLSIFDVTPTQVSVFQCSLKKNDGVAAPYIELFRLLRAQQGKPVIALVWNAGEKFEGDRKFRSMSHVQAARLAVSCPQYIWINGNIDTELSEPFCNVQPWKTWEQTAAILSCCDGVISVDTGPMHVAGAMGLPLWIALSGNSDWKYLKVRSIFPGGVVPEDKCYWYPHARVFRNRGIGFEDTINQLIARLSTGDFPGRQHGEPANLHGRRDNSFAQPCSEGNQRLAVPAECDSVYGSGNGSKR